MVSRLVAAGLIAASLLTLSACGLVGDSEEAKICKQLSKLGGKDNYTPTEFDISSCTWHLEAEKTSRPAVYTCSKGCVETVKTFDALSPCFESCDISNGAGGVKASVKVVRNSPAGGVTFKVKTKAKAKVEINLTQTYGSPVGPKKGKASKKGQAKVTFPQISRGTYEAEIKVTLGKKITVLKEPVVVDFSAVEFEGVAASGTPATVECDLQLEAPSADTVRPKGELKSGNDRLTLRFKVSGGKSLKLDSQSATFTKDKATASIELGNRVGDIKGSFISGGAPRISLPFSAEAKGAKLKGNLNCALPSVQKLFIPYSQQPITFTGDIAKGDNSTLLLRYGSYKSILGNSNATLKQIDYVAVVTSVEKKLGACPYYDPNTNSNVRVERSRYDETAVIYDRRTGKKLKSKSFNAKHPGCPRTLSPGSSISEWVDSAKVDEWITTTAAGLK